MRRVLGLLLCLASSLAACKGEPMASRAQCEKLLDRYIDLKLSESVQARAMSDVDRAHLRGQIAMQVLSDSDVQQVNNQCETQVTEKEYRCAVQASTSKQWNDCIE